MKPSIHSCALTSLSLRDFLFLVLNVTRRSIKAYTVLPVVRVTQKQKAVNWVVLKCRVPVFQVGGH